MKKLKTVIIVFAIFSLFGFKNEKSSVILQKNEKHSIPADFSFVINSGGNDSYNSKYTSFYRLYLEGEKTIKVELTKDEKEKIYSFIMKINFFKMPVKFQPKGIISVGNPSFTESIVIHANGKKKFVSYHTGYTNDLNDQKAKPFLDLYKMIWDILYKKKEIIALPESDQYYE
ncbi:hypothetical protein [Flavobacterium sp. HJJ]|uniref:hypothetical protein n=1 Tax=Flavobacterium sp. HJJ TaxID=2783792 RepID=UPI00188D850F|nr:hypothetical protein [Flavobacterium sp. HJJ]MBF4471447.1 hypothetical protein [Flavobacterium sp. HJJ]